MRLNGNLLAQSLLYSFRRNLNVTNSDSDFPKIPKCEILAVTMLTHDAQHGSWGLFVIYYESCLLALLLLRSLCKGTYCIKLGGPDILTAGNTVLIREPLFHWLGQVFPVRSGHLAPGVPVLG